VGDWGSGSRPWHEHGYVKGLLTDRCGPSQGEARFSEAALKEKQDLVTWWPGEDSQYWITTYHSCSVPDASATRPMGIWPAFHPLSHTCCINKCARRWRWRGLWCLSSGVLDLPNPGFSLCLSLCLFLNLQLPLVRSTDLLMQAMTMKQKAGSLKK
jgi:hypothetical protein